jgi:hypothetical protein
MLVRVPAKAGETVPTRAAMPSVRPSPGVTAAPSVLPPTVAAQVGPAIEPATADGAGSNGEVAAPPAAAATARPKQRTAKPPAAGNVWSLFRQFERSGS